MLLRALEHSDDPIRLLLPTPHLTTTITLTFVTGDDLATAWNSVMSGLLQSGARVRGTVVGVTFYGEALKDLSPPPSSVLNDKEPCLELTTFTSQEGKLWGVAGNTMPEDVSKIGKRGEKVARVIRVAWRKDMEARMEG